MDTLFGNRGQLKLSKAAVQELRRVQLEDEDEDAAVAQTEVSHISTTCNGGSLQVFSGRIRDCIEAALRHERAASD